MEGRGGRDGGRRGDHCTESSGDGGQGGGGKNISKVSKVSIAVIAQTTGVIISFHFSDASPLRKPLLVSSLFTNLLGYLSSLSSISLVDDMPEVAKILGVIGIVACVLGFILMIALSLPANIVWIVVLPCLVFFLLIVMVICIAKFVMKGPQQITPRPPVDEEEPRADDEEPVEANGSPRADEEETVEDQVLNESPRVDEEKPGEEEEPGETQILNEMPQADAQARTGQLVRRNPRARSEEDHPIYGKVLHGTRTKAVVKLSMDGKKSRVKVKAMSIAALQEGVISLSIEGQDKDQLVVLGDGIDHAQLISKLRKRVGFAKLISVSPVEEKKVGLTSVGPVEEKKVGVTSVGPVEEKKVEPHSYVNV